MNEKADGYYVSREKVINECRKRGIKFEENFDVEDCTRRLNDLADTPIPLDELRKQLALQ